MTDLVISKECSICYNDGANVTRYCVYCVALLMCTECRRKLHQQECPQCRRQIPQAPPDVLITGSRPCKATKRSRRLKDGLPSRGRFNFTIIPHSTNDGTTHLRIGISRPAGFDVYARPGPRPHTAESTAHVLYLRTTQGRFELIKHEFADSKERLVESVALLPRLRHLGWLEFLAFMVSAHKRCSPSHLRYGDRIAIPERLIDALQSSTQGTARNPITL